MRKFYILLLTLATLMVGNTVNAQGVWVGVISYTVDTDARTATMTSSSALVGDVVLPETVTIEGVEYTVTAIGDEAFRDRTSLTSIEIPNSVTSIGARAFYGCGVLSSVKIGDGVISIGDEAFFGLTDLISVKLGNAVQTIGANAFNACRTLASFDFPQSVTTIGDNAFFFCDALTTVRCWGSTPPTVGSGAFLLASHSTATLYVPEGAKAAYEAVSPWNEFGTIEEFTPTAIRGISADVEGTEAIYTLDGRRTNALKKGVNVVKGSDGKTRKVIAK